MLAMWGGEGEERREEKWKWTNDMQAKWKNDKAQGSPVRDSWLLDFLSFPTIQDKSSSLLQDKLRTRSNAVRISIALSVL